MEDKNVPIDCIKREPVEENNLQDTLDTPSSPTALSNPVEDHAILTLSASNNDAENEEKVAKSSAAGSRVSPPETTDENDKTVSNDIFIAKSNEDNKFASDHIKTEPPEENDFQGGETPPWSTTPSHSVDDHANMTSPATSNDAQNGEQMAASSAAGGHFPSLEPAVNNDQNVQHNIVHAERPLRDDPREMLIQYVEQQMATLQEEKDTEAQKTEDLTSAVNALLSDIDNFFMEDPTTNKSSIEMGENYGPLDFETVMEKISATRELVKTKIEERNNNNMPVHVEAVQNGQESDATLREEAAGRPVLVQQEVISDGKPRRKRGRPRKITTAHGPASERSLTCKCSVAFSSTIDLQKHMKKFMGNGEHACSICFQKFMYYSKLREHRKRVHEIDIQNERNLTGCRCGEVCINYSALLEHKKSCNFVMQTTDKGVRLSQNIENVDEEPSTCGPHSVHVASTSFKIESNGHRKLDKTVNAEPRNSAKVARFDDHIQD